eukprot:g80991.t1
MCRAVGGNGWESRGGNWWSVGGAGPGFGAEFVVWHEGQNMPSRVLGRFACVRVLGLVLRCRERWLSDLAAKARGKDGLVRRHVSWRVASKNGPKLWIILGGKQAGR